MPRLRQLTLAVAVAAAAFGLLAADAAATGSPSARIGGAPRDALTIALRSGAIDEAQHALQRALSAFDYEAVRARVGVLARPGPRDATLLLRELAMRRGELSGADRDLADAILARPDATVSARPDDFEDPFETHYEIGATVERLCPAEFCVNWVETGAHAVPAVDEDANGLPDYVDAVIAEMTTVWNAEIGQGYRAPKSDADSPSTGDLDERIDIYLVDLGPGLFGYCTTDDPKTFDPAYPGFDGSAYCVLDNEYESVDYGPYAGLVGLRATAAHEFFHAVQYAYNVFQDGWFLEASATWMEDQVYDDLDTPSAYLSTSQVWDTSVPLDLDSRSFDDDLSLYKYGAFTFVQWVSEQFGPAIVREWLEAGDGSPGHEPEFAAFALENVLQARGTSFRRVYNGYGAAILDPPSFFEEGASWFFDFDGTIPAAADLPGVDVLNGKRSTTGRRTVRLDHMTTQYGAVRPGAGVRARSRLKVKVDLPSRAGGGEASLLVVGKNGKLSVLPVPTNAKGNGSRTIRFGRTRLVIVVLSNASLRFADCTLQQFELNFTCHGVPLDDGRAYRYTATLIR